MRVLVIEDEQRIARSIKKGLELERYAVDLAFSGPEGFSLACTEEYDLVILDLMLPEMDGVEIAKKLREKKIQTPILMLTAKSQIDEKVAGLNAGADDYLTKPFSFEELLARLRAISRRPKQLLNTVLALGPLTLNSSSYEVERSGQHISLSSKEFALLEYLLRNQKKILTKDQIIRHVWDYDADILPNTVEVYIRNLRKKIDEPFEDEKPIIQTVRGFGYKLAEN